MDVDLFDELCQRLFTLGLPAPYIRQTRTGSTITALHPDDQTVLCVTQTNGHYSIDWVPSHRRTSKRYSTASSLTRRDEEPPLELVRKLDGALPLPRDPLWCSGRDNSQIKELLVFDTSPRLPSTLFVVTRDRMNRHYEPQLYRRDLWLNVQVFWRLVETRGLVCVEPSVYHLQRGETDNGHVCVVVGKTNTLLTKPSTWRQMPHLNINDLVQSTITTLY